MLNKIMRKISSLVELASLFGPRSGLEIWLALFSRGRMQGEFSVKVPGWPSPITLRRSTSDSKVFCQIFLEEQYDLAGFAQTKRIQDRYEAILKAGHHPVILDAGANIGLSTIWFRMKFPKARIYAIEPHAGNFQALKTNVGQLENVYPIRSAIWNCRKQLSIFDDQADEWAFRIVEQAESSNDGSRTIPATTVEDILQEAGSTSLLVAKIDIEGGEQALFSNNSGWLANTDLLIIELHDWLFPWAGTSRPFLNLLASTNGDVLIKGENLLVFRQ